MQPENSTPFAPLSPFALNGNLSTEGFHLSRVLFLGSLLFSQGGSGRFTIGDGDDDGGGVGGMDFSKVGEKILSSVRSARSLGLLPSTSDRPEVPARAAAAASIARALAGIPSHQRHSLSSSSEELSSIYGSRPRGQIVEELEEEFYDEEFDPVRHVLEHLPSEENELTYLEEKATLRLAQLDRIAERLSRHVMEHHEEMVKGMQLVSELEKDLKVANVICMNGRRHLTSSRNEISRDLYVPTNSRRKQALLDTIPILTELRHAVDMQVALESHVDKGDFVKAFQVLSEYLQVLDSLSELSAIQEMSHGVEVWLGKTLQKLDSLLLGVCQDFAGTGYITVVDAYALIGDVSGLAEKIQSFFMQEVLSETHTVLKNIVQEGNSLGLILQFYHCTSSAEAKSTSLKIVDKLQHLLWDGGSIFCLHLDTTIADLLSFQDQGTPDMQSTRLTYSDLCTRVPESKFRQCLLATLAALFKLMCSYYAIMSFELESEVSTCQLSPVSKKESDISGSSQSVVDSLARSPDNSKPDGNGTVGQDSMGKTTIPTPSPSDANGTNRQDSRDSEERDVGAQASSSGSPWFHLQKDATTFVSQTLQRGRKNLWQLTTSRVSVLLSSPAVCSASIHQFLKNYEDLNIFILAGEAFCGFEVVEFRQKVKSICENYFIAFHRQNISALKMVMEKETWLTLPPDLIQVVSFAGLVGDGAALIIPSDTSSNTRVLHSHKSTDSIKTDSRNIGFSHWLNNGNMFSLKLNSKESYDTLSPKSAITCESDRKINGSSQMNSATSNSDANHINGNNVLSKDENEDLHADFIDEDSQLPSRIAKPQHSRSHSSSWNGQEMRAQTGSSLCLLRLMDKYARLMQKLEIVNVEFFKGICELFGIFFYFVFENFGQLNPNTSGKGSNDALSYRLKTALSRITQDCDRLKSPSVSFSSSSPGSMNIPFTHMDVTPTSPPSTNFSQSPSISFGLKERCAGAETLSLVAKLLHRSKTHLQSMLLQNNTNVVEDFYLHLVDSVPDLVEQIHRTTARSLLHIRGYVDRIANAKWEVKELGMEHNGYVDLLLGEFKHYRTRLAHGGIEKEVQDLLLEYGVENLAETLIEGLSRVKRCTDEGRALMSLDVQVLINGLQHFVSINVKPKLQIVEAFIKAYYLPETEYVHWARGHPEYSKSQMVGLVNLVATMKSWKRKTRLEVIEKIESA